LLGPTPTSSGQQQLEPARYYVLALFFVLMANQCLFWFTFSADPSTFKAYYPGLTTAAIDQCDTSPAVAPRLP
jgi:NADH:ubiquinone oxidoreductase subunit 3 (subunit A)